MTDRWLLKVTAGDAVLAALRAVAGVEAWRALDSDLVYAYAPADTPRHLLAAAAWIPLRAVLELRGASAGVPAPHHYVVETDVLPGHEEDFNAWYDREHAPGLAAVPGTVRAARYVNHAGSPRYYACYDLVSPQTLGSAPWLAVRGTAWSSRVRPAFRNTRRTMFRRLVTEA